MLQNLRDQKNSALIVILFAVIIIVFIFMFGLPGADSFSSKNQADVAKVGAHRVTYDLMRTMILNQYDDNILNTTQYPGVARQITENIGVIYLLADEAKAAGLRVSDEDLHDYITNWESGNNDIIRYGFLQKNEFSQRNYNDALRRMQLSARDYENYKREELLARRYLTLLASSITVSDESLWDAYKEANSTVTLDVIRLTPENVGKTFKPLSNEEIRAFSTSGKADIQAYYDDHIADFTTPEKVKMQQIVISKSFGKIENPGAKTMTTLQSAERFQIAKNDVEKNHSDFAKAYADYDESADKSLQGISALLPVDIMADEIQTAIEGKNIGDTFSAELPDRYIIGKLLERTPKIIKPVEEVSDEIAKTLLNDRRISNKTAEITTNILAQASATPLDTLLDKTMYAGILSEPPKAPAPIVADNAEDNGVNDQPTTLVEIPTDLLIIPTSDRAKVDNVKDIAFNTNFLQGIGVNDDLARDIRSANDGTVLSQTYKIGKDTLIVKIVSKTPANQETFKENLEAFRAGAIQARTESLIGNIDDILNLRGEYGIWIEQKIQEAMTSGKLKISNDYFNKVARQIQKRQEERNQE